MAWEIHLHAVRAHMSMFSFASSWLHQEARIAAESAQLVPTTTRAAKSIGLPLSANHSGKVARASPAAEPSPKSRWLVAQIGIGILILITNV